LKPQQFIPLSQVVEEHGSDRESFLRAFPRALLVLDEIGEPDSEVGQFQTIAAKVEADQGPQGRALTKLLGKLPGGSGQKWVTPLDNRAKKFACILTFGRAANSDIRVNVPSLSKFHAFFTHVSKDGCWYLADANSSNGTFLNGHELPSSHGKVRLDNGAFLRFGPDVTGHYYDSEAFWELLHSAVAGGEGGEPPARSGVSGAGDEEATA
jgi:hypothetical protein